VHKCECHNSGGIHFNGVTFRLAFFNEKLGLYRISGPNSRPNKCIRIRPYNTAKSRPNTNSDSFSIITKLTAFSLELLINFSEFNDFASTHVFYTHTHKFVTLNVNAFPV